MKRFEQEGDSGAALVLALAMIAIISIGLLGLATQTDTNLRDTAKFASVQTRATGSEAAIDQVITQLRNSSADGTDPTSGSGGTCTGPGTYTIPSGRYGNDSAITVTCTAKPNSGAPGSPGGPGLNIPPHAVLATSTTQTGLTVGGNGTLNVGGDILSNSPLTTGNGSITTSIQSILKTTAAIKAVGSCTGPAANYSPACVTGATAQPDYDGQPGWDHELLPGNTIAASGITGHCGTGNGLSPGIYTDAVALNTLILGCNNVVWFKPGVYYFDFASSSHVLSVTNANAHLVGGVLSSTPTTVGSACNETVDGVQFVFGGDSRISVTGGSLELCPYVHSTQQEIAIYGLRHTIPKSAQSTPAQLPSTTGSSTGKGAFTNPNNALAFDTSYATYTGANSKDGTLNLGGFDFSSVPSGSTINSASIRVRYKVANATSSLTSLGLTVQDGGTGTTTIGDSVAVGCATGTTLCRNTAGVVVDQTFALTKPASTTALSGMSAGFTATTAKNGSASDVVSIDAVSIVVNYTPPATYNAQSGCVVTVGGCDFLFADGSNTTLAIHGTFYSWSGTLNMNLPNNIGVAIRRGAVARTLALNVPGSLQQSTPIISLPPLPPPVPGQDRDVVLTATTGGIVVLRVEVTFDKVTQVPAISHWSMVEG